MSSFYLAFGLHVNAVVGQEKRRNASYCIFVVWAFSCRRSKTIRIRRTDPKPIACSLCLSPSLYPDFKRSLFKEASVLAFKEPENEPKTIQFLKILLGSLLPEPPLYIARYFHLPCSTHTHLSNKNPAYGPLKMHHCIAGFWKGDSRDPQFGQNIVRDLRNVNVKRNFTATGLETGLRKFGQGCEM